MVEPKSLKKIPRKIGVYLFKDAQKRVLYVGKAINLRKRVASYFSKKAINQSKKTNLVALAKKVDYVLAANEIEALLLEAKLIKTYQPKYNTSLKDSSRYLYVGISKEEYPRIVLLRLPETEKNLTAWFGPFPTAGALKEILRLLRRIFPYRTCKLFPKRKCLFHHLNLCACFRPKEEYLRNLTCLKLFLSGEISPLVKWLKRAMAQAACLQEYEKAAVYKKQVEMVESLLGSYHRLPEAEKVNRQLLFLRKLLIRYQGLDPLVIKRLEAYDVANLGQDITVGSLATFINGEPSFSFYRQFRVKALLNDTMGIKEIISRRLGHQEWIYPQVILVDGGKGQVAAAFSALKTANLEGQISVLGLAKKEERIVIPKIAKGKIVGWRLLCPPSSSLVLQLLQFARDEAHRFAQRYYKTLHRKEIP